ncbi:MAG TPA: aldo/keto reductase [Dermatophilaceae bacterium]|nr:aldo/keto reductase [Dermatophilaceae bacterium]
MTADPDHPEPASTVAVGTLRTLPLCLGGNVFGWTADEPTSHAVLDAFLAGGGSLVDTADVYSAWVPGHAGGESEAIIGRWLAARGADGARLRVATKVGKHPQLRGLAPETVRAALDDSRRRLGRDTVDLYYAHEDDPSRTVDEIAEIFGTLVREGSVRNWGLSNVSAERTQAILDAAQAAGYPLPVAVQPNYSLVHRTEVETQGLDAVCRAEHLAILPYYPLAAGFLTGKYRPGTAVQGERAARAAAYLTDDGLAVLDAVDAVAAETDSTPVAVALAWLRAQPMVAAPIASASRPEQVPALLAGAALRLSAEQVARLDAASAPFR